MPEAEVEREVEAEVGFVFKPMEFHCEGALGLGLGLVVVVVVAVVVVVVVEKMRRRRVSIMMRLY